MEKYKIIIKIFRNKNIQNYEKGNIINWQCNMDENKVLHSIKYNIYSPKFQAINQYV